MKRLGSKMPEHRHYNAKLKGFTPVLDVMVQEFDILTALIYGVVWRYCQDKDGVCRASLETIALRVGVSRKTVERRIKILCDHGFLIDTTPGRKNAPHIYADSGKARIIGTVEAKIGESDSHTTSGGETQGLTKQVRSDRESEQIMPHGQPQSLMKKEVVVTKTTTTQQSVVVEIDPITAGTPFAKISKRALDKHVELYGKDRVIAALDILVETYRHNPHVVRNPSSLLASGLRLKNLIPPDNFIPWHERQKREQEWNETARMRQQAHKQEKQTEEKVRQIASDYFESLHPTEKKELLSRAQAVLPKFLRDDDFIKKITALDILMKEAMTNVCVA